MSKRQNQIEIKARMLESELDQAEGSMSLRVRLGKEVNVLKAGLPDDSSVQVFYGPVVRYGNPLVGDYLAQSAFVVYDIDEGKEGETIGPKTTETSISNVDNELDKVSPLLSREIPFT